MKLTDEDRILVFLISRAYPPLLQDDPSPQKAVVDWPAVIARAERQALTPLLFDAVKELARRPAGLGYDHRFRRRYASLSQSCSKLHRPALGHAHAFPDGVGITQGQQADRGGRVNHGGRWCRLCDASGK